MNRGRVIGFRWIPAVLILWVLSTSTWAQIPSGTESIRSVRVPKAGAMLGSPADLGGLLVGDVLTHIDGTIAAEYGWPDFQTLEVRVADLPTETPEELAGRYAFRGREWVLTLEEDGRLLLEREGGFEQELIERVFGHRYAVERGAGGSVVGLTLVVDATRLFTFERLLSGGEP